MPWYGQIPHVSRESPLSLTVVPSEALPVFLKHFLTPGQGATEHSLGFNASDHWLINTGLGCLPYHLSQVRLLRKCTLGGSLACKMFLRCVLRIMEGLNKAGMGRGRS